MEWTILCFILAVVILFMLLRSIFPSITVTHIQKKGTKQLVSVMWNGKPVDILTNDRFWYDEMYYYSSLEPIVELHGVAIAKAIREYKFKKEALNESDN